MQLEKAAGALGAYITGINLAEAATSETLFAEVHAALIEHEVLFFRDQNLEPLEYQTFAHRFGRVEGHPAYPTVPGAADVQVLESTAEAPTKIESWHSDMTFRPEPPALTLLYGRIIPAYGGDTMWASATAAHDTLSGTLRNLLGGMGAVHDFRQGFRESIAEPGGAERLAGAIAENPPVIHPLIRTHPESGRGAIFVNRLFTSRIEGLSISESDALLEFLYQHLVIEEHTVRLRWRPDTVAIWDNRSTQHKPVNDFFPQHRKMFRITIAGDVPT